MIEQFNALAEAWWGWMAGMFWQVGLLIVLIACIDRLVRRWAWPQLRYALWSLILIKLILPPTLSLPSGVVPELRPMVGQALKGMESAEAPEIADWGLGIADSMHYPDARAVGAYVEARSFDESLPFDGKNHLQASLEGDIAANPKAEIRNPKLNWQVYAMVVWLVGIVVLGIWLVLRLHSFAGRRASVAAAASLPQSFYNQLAGCAKRLGLRRVPRVVVARRLATPAVFGVFRPVLLMPKGYLSKLSRRDTEHMLLHELAHIRRGDLTMHGLHLLLQIVYWYNPLLWLVRRQMHHLRELSCDATVAELLREQTTAYRQTLLESARRLLATSAEPGLGLLGLFEDSNRLAVRLDWLARPTWRYKTMKRVIVGTMAILMFVCVLPMAQGPARAAVAEETSKQQNAEQVSRELAELQAKLEQLESERLKLQKELQALAQARVAEVRAKHATVEAAKAKADAGRASVAAARAKAKAGTATVSAAKAKDAVAKAKSKRKKANSEAPLIGGLFQSDAPDGAMTAAEQKKWAQEMEAWAQQMEQWQDGEEMRKWQQSVQQWQNSKEFKNWQKQLQKWGEARAEAHRSGDGAPSEPMPPMPPMPVMPAMPAAPTPVPIPIPQPVVVPEIEVPAVSVATPAPIESTVVDADVDVTESVSVEVKTDATADADAAADGLRMIQSVDRKQDGRSHVLVRTEQTTIKVAPGSAVNLVNENGAISIMGTDRDTCQVQSVFTLKAPTTEAANKLSKAVYLETQQTDEGLTIMVAEPAKMLRGHSARVDLQVLVPRDTDLSVKHGDGVIRVKNIAGRIAAFLEDGEIQCEDVEGVMGLRLEDGRVVINRAQLAGCEIKMEDGQISCEDITGSLEVELDDGVVAVTYGDEMPEDCEIQVDLSDGSIKLSAPKAMFPADAPDRARRQGDGAEWKTTAETDAGKRVVDLLVGDGAIKVEKR